MYYAFIHPYFQYCVTVWGSTFKTYLNGLHKLQKRAIRIICGETKYAHTAPLRKAMGLLTISEIYIYAVHLFMFKYNHFSLPDMFSIFFTLNSDVHNYFTRQHDMLHTPFKCSLQLIRVKGVIINNYFSIYIDKNCTFTTYKKRLKAHMQHNDVEHLVQK